jgi:hypothetical protein
VAGQPTAGDGRTSPRSRITCAAPIADPEHTHGKTHRSGQSRLVPPDALGVPEWICESGKPFIDFWVFLIIAVATSAILLYAGTALATSDN